MAKLKDLKVTIGLSKKGLTKLNGDIRRMKGNFRRNFGEIAGMVKNAALAITGTLVAGVGVLIKKGAEMETLRTGFISIAGGANKAAAIVAELNDFAAKTPFQLEEISSAARKLLATGSKRSELTKELKFLGDVAASSGNSIDDIAAIFTKVRAKGKVELENLNQLAERNIPIFDELRKVTGDANMEFGAGAVSVEEFSQALRGMAEEGGIAAGAMENLSETVEGRITTLMDNLGQELAGFAERSGISDAFGAVLKDATEALQGISGVTQTDIAAALGKAEEAMEAFGGATTANVDEVETLMADAAASVKNLQDQLQAGARQRTGIAALFGGISGGKEALREQVKQFTALQEVLDSLTEAGVELNNAVQAGTVPAETQQIEQNTAQLKQNKKVKEELLEVEKSRLLTLGTINEMQATTAVDILAAAQANHTLKGSIQAVQAAVIPTRDALVAMGEYAATQLPGFFENAFGVLMDGTQDFGQYMMTVLESLLKKLAAMLAAFAAMSVLFPGSAVVKEGLGKFLAGGFNIPAFAAGGLVSGATLAMVGEGAGTSLTNPEVIAPLDKLQSMMGGNQVQVTGVLRGQDILLTNERALIDRNRLRSF